MSRRTILIVVLILMLGSIGVYIGARLLQSTVPVAVEVPPTNSPAPVPSLQPTSLPTQPPPTLPLPTAVPTSQPSPLPTEEPVATLPPPLSAIIFPTQRINYPADWPTDLQYPDSFMLVEARSGSVPDGGASGWAVKLRYSGDPKSAAELLTTFFAKQGWNIMDRIEQESGGLTLLLERDNRKNSGVVELEQDSGDLATTKIAAVVFP